MNKAIALGATLLAFTLPATVRADFSETANLELKVEITAETCTASASDANKPVQLNNWSSKYLSGKEGATPRVGFTLNLEGCPPTDKVAITFDGTPATEDSQLLALDKGKDAATGVAIELFDSDLTRLPLKQASKPITSDANGNAKFTFYARYKVTGSAISTGGANATAQYSITYD